LVLRHTSKTGFFVEALRLGLEMFKWWAVSPLKELWSLGSPYDKTDGNSKAKNEQQVFTTPEIKGVSC
jgi:hypothetical protein